MNARPWMVTTVASVHLVGTAFAAVGGLALLLPGSGLEAFWRLNPAGHALFASVGAPAGIGLVVLGAFTLAAGVGLLGGRRWAWWLAAGVLCVVAAINGTRFWLGDPGEWFGTPFTLLLIVLHGHPRSRAFFFPTGQ